MAMTGCLQSGVLACLLLVMVTALLVTRSTTASPIDEDGSDIDSDKGMLLEKYLELGNRVRGLRPDTDTDSPSGLYVPPSFSNFLKRAGSPRSSRSGGMSLCLWKVCPAAPWLINK